MLSMNRIIFLVFNRKLPNMTGESEMALTSLREVQSKLEREIEWILSDDETLNQYTILHYISAIDNAISSLINFLESKK